MVTERPVRRALMALVGATLSMALVSACEVGADGAAGSRLRHGPLDPRDSARGYSSTGLVIRRPGGVATFAQFALHNHGRRSVEIDRVSLVPPPGGRQVELVEAGIAHDRTPPYVFDSVSGRPPKSDYPELRRAEGAVVPAKARGEYILVLTVKALSDDSDGLARADAVDVSYHQGAHQYRDRWNTQIVLCPGSCRFWDTPGPQRKGPWAPKPFYVTES